MLKFHNDIPEGLLWSLGVRMHRPIAAVKMDILSDRRTDRGYPAVWIETDWDDRSRRCRVGTDFEGQIRYREVLAAE